MASLFLQSETLRDRRCRSIHLCVLSGVEFDWISKQKVKAESGLKQFIAHRQFLDQSWTERGEGNCLKPMQVAVD